jgi:general secretion pathway protein C
VASSIGDAPPAKPATKAMPIVKVDPKSGRPILKRNPFDSVTGPLDGVSQPIPTPGDDEDEEDDVEGDPDTEDPSCGFGSVSIIMTAEDPDWSFASITDDSGTAKLRRIGDPVGEYTIEAMAWDRIWLTKDSSRCQMKVRDEQAPKKTARKPSPRTRRTRRRRRGAPKLPDELASKITKVSDTEYNIERSVVDDILEKQAELMRYTRLKPVKDGDKVVGLRMSRIRSGTLLDVLGLKNGDQVQSINGFDLTDPQKALEAYGRLRTADRLTLKVVRGGNPSTIDYNIQ